MSAHREHGETGANYVKRLVKGGNGEPRVFVWMARGLVVLGFWVALQAFAGSTGVVVIKFMGKPLLEEMEARSARRDSIIEARSARRDSTIVAQLGAQIETVGRNQVIQERRMNLMAEGLKYPYGSRQRATILGELQEQRVLRPSPVQPLKTDAQPK